MLKIGKVSKSNGTDGELVISFSQISPEDLNLKEPVFIEFDGLPVPFFIDSFTLRGGSKALVHLTDISSYEDAEEVVGKDLFIEEGSLSEETIEENLSILIGWRLYSPKGEVGEIFNVMDIPNNTCIEVQTKNGEVIIPLHDDLIISIDPKKMRITMEIPEGLI